METHNQQSKIRVLSLNGGGVRGLFTISLLAEMERVLSKGDESYSIAQHFDLIAGTSIGGLLALGLADGKNARELKESVEAYAQKIFPPANFVQKILRFFKKLGGHQYNGDDISKAVKAIVGSDRTIRDLKRRVLIPTLNITSGRPYFIKTCHNPRFTRDDQFNLVDVALATSAAPTYFQPHYIECVNSYFVDGGLLANNPSLVAHHEVVTDLLHEFPNLKKDDVFILNIGTMSSEFCINPERINNTLTGYLGLWRFGKDLIETVMTGNQLMHGYMVNRAVAVGNYVSLDDTVPNQQAGIITLDNAKNEALQVLIARGKQRATEALADQQLIANFFNDKAPEFIHPEDR